MVNNQCLDTLSTGRAFDTFRECSIAGYEMILDQAHRFAPLQFEVDKPAFLFDCMPFKQEAA